MPHLILEYSANAHSKVEVAKVLQIAQGEMMKSGLFNAGDIKSRAYMAEDYLVGEKGKDGSFVHVTVYLLEGRTAAQKQDLTQAIFNALLAPLEKVEQISVDIRDMVKDTYRKSAASGK